jgi:hypothetical protein
MQSLLHGENYYMNKVGNLTNTVKGYTKAIQSYTAKVQLGHLKPAFTGSPPIGTCCPEWQTSIMFSNGYNVGYFIS